MTWPGLGGLPPPPLNSAAGGALTPGVTPGITSGIILARYVIVSGPGGGMFVYSGTPAAGNPPIFWATSATTDPYGNTLPSTAGVAGTGTFEAGETVISPAGVFVYSATPALDNLIMSVSNTAGTDSFGNAWLAGLVTYGGTSGQWQALVLSPGANLATSGFAWYQSSAATMTGWTITGSFRPIFNGAVTLANNGQGFILGQSAGELTEIQGWATFTQRSSSPGAPGTGDTVYANANNSLIAIHATDQNLYNTQTLTVATTGTITINSTSPIVIVSATVGLLTYRVHIQISYVGGGTAASATLGWDGTAVIGTLIGCLRRARASTNADIVSPVNQTGGLGNFNLAFNVGENCTYEFDGLMTVTTAGTFNIRGQEGTAGDTWAVGTGSYLEIQPVG